jgi:hypothetical protein
MAVISNSVSMSQHSIPQQPFWQESNTGALKDSSPELFSACHGYDFAG